nr:uncharacterized protein LOC111508811 isoform X1 [Leptinotarsa decemlineata]
MPPLFHQDNYDQCMLLDDDALYCSFTYKVRSKTNGENGMWKIIQEVSSDKYNYRHDHLRHWICVPSTCPEINFHGKNHSEVQKDVEHCYNTKYSRYGLRGSIENFKCDNRSSKYPMDWLDIVVAMIFTLNVVVVVFGTFYEGTARFKSEEEYQKLTSKGWRRIVSAFSIPRNWHRLITVNITPDNEKLRSMQGIRFYTSLIVILAHTVLSATMGPIANTKYVEMIPGTAVSVLLSNGCLIMSLFFFTSAFFVMYGLFSQFEKRELKLKDLVGAVISRYIRYVVLFININSYNESICLLVRALKCANLKNRLIDFGVVFSNAFISVGW